MRCPTIASERPRSGSPRTSQNQWTRGRSSPRCSAGSAVERALPPDSVAAPATEAWKRLIVGVGVGYLAAWAIGVGFGLVLQGMGIWQGGAAWEHSMLAWIHDPPLPPFLDSLMLPVAYAGTNSTLLPLFLVVRFVLWLPYPSRFVSI